MKSRTFFLAGLALISLLLAGCKVNIVTTVDSAGKGDFRTEIVFTAEEVQSLSSFSGGSGENICDSLQTQNSLSGATVTQETRGNETYCIATKSFASLDELTNLYGQMDGVTINELSLENGRLVYNVDIDLSGDEVGGMFSPSFEWQLNVPGSVGQHNADRVEGRTLIWKLTPGKTINMRAESIVGGSSIAPNTALVILISLILVISGAIAFVLVRKLTLSETPSPSRR